MIILTKWFISFFNFDYPYLNVGIVGRRDTLVVLFVIQVVPTLKRKILLAKLYLDWPLTKTTRHLFDNKL